MNPVAYKALIRTRQQLSEEQKKWLRRAPFQRIPVSYTHLAQMVVEAADKEDEYSGISDTHTRINLNETGEQVVVVRLSLIHS